MSNDWKSLQNIHAAVDKLSAPQLSLKREYGGMQCVYVWFIVGSWNKLENTPLEYSKIPCKPSNVCHIEVKIPSNLFKLLIANAVQRNVYECWWIQEEEGSQSALIQSEGKVRTSSLRIETLHPEAWMGNGQNEYPPWHDSKERDKISKSKLVQGFNESSLQSVEHATNSVL